MTFSLAGRCQRTGMHGAVVTSSSPAVAARCVAARAGIGAACTQNVTDPRLGPALLNLLAAGASAPDALTRLIATTPHIAYRQLTVIDAQGRSAAYSGANTLGRHATHTATDCVAAGNLLRHDHIPRAMTDAFENHPELDLGDRLVRALRAG
jgi:uncharacterized Ntn-hydrolase superfamily protein